MGFGKEVLAIRSLPGMRDGELGCCCWGWSTGRRLSEVRELPINKSARAVSSSAMPEQSKPRGHGATPASGWLWQQGELIVLLAQP